MRNKLVRIYGEKHLHFITLFECRGAAMSLSRRRAAAERTLSAKTKTRAPSAKTTSSCYRRQRLLGRVGARNLFMKALGDVRKRYESALVGFVVMPEHTHLLIGESKLVMPSTVVHSLKLRVSKRMRRGLRKKSLSQRILPFREGETALPQFWQKRFYDFNAYSAAKRREKLEYMHRNPVTRRLVKDPKDWVWSSYSPYSGRGTPLVEIDFVV
jgi:putative transposase